MTDNTHTEKVSETHTDAKPATDTKTTEVHNDAKGGEPANDSKKTEPRQE